MSLHTENPMDLLRTLEGEGVLRFDGQEHPVRYRLCVWRRGGTVKADGGIEGAPEMLLDSYKQPRCTLDLATGEPVEIIVMHYGHGTGADIVVSGPLPA